MVIIAAVALMLTFGLMRSTARGARRDGAEGIRWRGIDWSAGAETEAGTETGTEAETETGSETEKR